MIIFPSPHYQDIEQLKTVFKTLDPFCQGYHIDIMDGQFVSNTMGSVELTNQIAQTTNRQLWIHLMVQDPLSYLETLKLRSGDIVSAHYTALKKSVDEFSAKARELKLEPSLAIAPSIDIQTVLPLCKIFNHFLIMSVEPGKAGQIFLPGTLSKITNLVTYRAHQEISLTIALDGGVTQQNIKKLKSAGVSSVAATSAIFTSDKPETWIESFKRLYE